jgi:hypothetical protein
MNIVTRGLGLGQYAGPLVTSGLGLRFGIERILSLVFTGPVHRAAFGDQRHAAEFGELLHGLTFRLLDHVARLNDLLHRAWFGDGSHDADADDTTRRGPFTG